jgi:hypothetical protein
MRPSPLPGICFIDLRDDAKLPNSHSASIDVVPGRPDFLWDLRGAYRENKCSACSSLCAYAAQTQNLKMISVRFPANGSTPNTVQFLCSQKYERTVCMKDASALRQAMARYPTQLLEQWSFSLVPADDRKALVRSQERRPGQSGVLDAGSAVDVAGCEIVCWKSHRNKELLQRFNLMGATLVDLAITHEMGHGICQEKDEHRADDYGRELRSGKIPDCSKSQGGSRPAWRPASRRRLPAARHDKKKQRTTWSAFELAGRDRATWS